ncbi:MAG TPA: hypothetical protein VNN08_08320 [Thermoanaerobaculia bacterium]|nr:hypothetical protein [Thermoanaerobaculia bacterium]
MRPGFALQDAEGLLLHGRARLHRSHLDYFHRRNQFQLPAAAQSGRNRTLQFRGKLRIDRLGVFRDEVVRQFADAEVLEKKALGQRTEVRLQPSDDLQHIE